MDGLTLMALLAVIVGIIGLVLVFKKRKSS
jgi:LPXTG-motif cell wall-anchored protein